MPRISLINANHHLLRTFSQNKKVSSYKRNMLVLVDTSSSMNTEDKRNAESIEDAARALGEIKADDFDISQANEIQTKIASPSRIELAKATLKNNDLVNRLSEQFNVGAFTFNSQLQNIEQDEAEAVNSDENPEPKKSIKLNFEADGSSTAIGSTMNEAIGKFTVAKLPEW